MLLPEVRTPEEYRQVYGCDEVWQPALRVICGRHGLDPTALRRAIVGTHVVYHAGDRIVKLFARIWREQCQAERAALQQAGDLPVPRILAEGEVEGWPYLVVTVLPGVPAEAAWDGVPPPEQVRILEELGALVRRLHAHQAADGVPQDWDAFLRQRLSRAEEHHGKVEPWLTWLRQRLAALDPQADVAPHATVLLHADITADHVLLTRAPQGWRLAGLIDFGDARLGHPCYEFIAPLACLTFGRPELSRALVRGYGWTPTAERVERLTTWCLLHEYGRIDDFLRRCPAVADGPAFHRALWGETQD